mmetsp:Transcript_10875/g.20447  ORF Transcript_10875/g.20447 Transcript_10875/m.20447 type:complete len:331 (+) Transcript_10875:956-1948(+)
MLKFLNTSFHLRLNPCQLRWLEELTHEVEQQFPCRGAEDPHPHQYLERGFGARLACHGASEEGPERHEEVAAAHAAEVEGGVGPCREDEDAPEAKALENRNHGSLHLGHHVMAHIQFIQLLIALITEFGRAVRHKVGWDFAQGGAEPPQESRRHQFGKQIQPGHGIPSFSFANELRAVGQGFLPHVDSGVEVEVPANFSKQHGLEDVRKEKEHARVQSRPQPNGGQHSQSHPPHHKGHVDFYLRDDLLMRPVHVGYSQVHRQDERHRKQRHRAVFHDPLESTAGTVVCHTSKQPYCRDRLLENRDLFSGGCAFGTLQPPCKPLFLRLFRA